MYRKIKKWSVKDFSYEDGGQDLGCEIVITTEDKVSPDNNVSSQLAFNQMALRTAINLDIKRIHATASEVSKAQYTEMLSNTLTMISKQAEKFLETHGIINNEDPPSLLFGNAEIEETDEDEEKKSDADFILELCNEINNTTTAEGIFLAQWAKSRGYLYLTPNMSSDIVKYNMAFITDMTSETANLYKSDDVMPWEIDLQNESVQVHMTELKVVLIQLLYALFAVNDTDNSIYSEVFYNNIEIDDEQERQKIIDVYSSYIKPNNTIYNGIKNDATLNGLIKGFEILSDGWRFTKLLNVHYRTSLSTNDNVDSDMFVIPEISYNDSEKWVIGASVSSLEVVQELTVKILNNIMKGDQDGYDTKKSKTVVELDDRVKADIIKKVLSYLEKKNYSCTEEDNFCIGVPVYIKNAIPTTMRYDEMYTVYLVPTDQVVDSESGQFCKYKLLIRTSSEIEYSCEDPSDKPTVRSVVDDLREFTGNNQIIAYLGANGSYIIGLLEHEGIVGGIDIPVITSYMTQNGFEMVGLRRKNHTDYTVSTNSSRIYKTVVDIFAGFYGTSMRTIAKSTHSILVNEHARIISNHYLNEEAIVNGIRLGYVDMFPSATEAPTTEDARTVNTILTPANKLGYLLLQELMGAYDPSKLGRIPLVSRGKVRLTGPKPLSIASVHDIHRILCPTARFRAVYSTLWGEIDQLLSDRRTIISTEIKEGCIAYKLGYGAKKRRFNRDPVNTENVRDLDVMLDTIGKRNVSFFAVVINTWAILQTTLDSALRQRQSSMLTENYRTFGNMLRRLLFKLSA
jgi:hypothetical protein